MSAITVDTLLQFLEEHGLYVAYGALLLGAVVPIIIGSFGSLKPEKKAAKQKKKSGKHEEDTDSEDEQEELETLSSEDAMWFPVMGSATLFGLYLLFRYFGKEYINYLLTGYFALLGTVAVAKSVSSLLGFVGITHMLHNWNTKYRLVLTNKKTREVAVKFSFDYVLIGSGVIAVLFTAYYVLTKNWIASNIFGEAFSISAIQLLDLDDFKTGFILLSGLFFYDIFWVFGTEVMVSVAKNFDAPVKILFPKSLFADKLQFTMLGLGDIVIPGIFVALCLRFDQHQAKDKKRFSKPYFTACLTAYVIGLVITVFVMHTFKAAQPALLYLSPACILSVLLTAAVRGELKQVLAYKSAASLEKEAKKEQEKKGK